MPRLITQPNALPKPDLTGWEVFLKSPKINQLELTKLLAGSALVLGSDLALVCAFA